MTGTIFTAKQLADCARREAGYRRKVYPARIAKGGLTKRLASRQIAMMQAIAAHFDEADGGPRFWSEGPPNEHR